jgi:hypothetical protein
MQFTSIIALVSALATTSVQAAPAATTALESRQALIAYIRFYGGGGWQEPWLEDTVFQQNDKCLSNTYAGPYGSFDVINNSFTRTSKFCWGWCCGGDMVLMFG